MLILGPNQDNQIPRDRFNPVALKMLAEYPDPNRAGSSITGRQNYLFAGNRGYSRDLSTTRLDHNFSEKHRIFGRYSQQKSLDTQNRDPRIPGPTGLGTPPTLTTFFIASQTT